MTILLTGACGIVGRETVVELVQSGHIVRAFDLATPKTQRQIKKIRNRLPRQMRQRVEFIPGNLTDLRAVSEACREVDAVIHLGAMIPPAADKAPLAAFYVNVAATELLVQTLERTNPTAPLVFTSSISVFGDRRENPLIAPNDQLNPNSHDWYGRQKVLAEGIIRNSSLAWAILRLTYIVSSDKLQMDPLMFAMPLDTSIEICHARDVARALSHAVEGLVDNKFRGQTFSIAGGVSCRTSYKAYLQEMFALFGLGNRWKLPENLWSTQAFHCAFMDTTQSQKALEFQTISLQDYYAEVSRACQTKRLFISMMRPLVWKWLANRSPLRVSQGPAFNVAETVPEKASRLARLSGLMEGMAGFIAGHQPGWIRRGIRDYPQ